MKEMIEVKIIWQGEQIKCMKSHKKLNCNLCMKERLEILKLWNDDKLKLINEKHELYGPCQCNTRFHRFVRTNTSTDDGFNLEKNDGDECLINSNECCNFTDDSTDISTDDESIENLLDRTILSPTIYTTVDV